MVGYKEDTRCVDVYHKPYPCLNCSATYLPCGGDCKPIIKKSKDRVVDNKWLNCCSYCIKTNSCAKLENEFLKSTAYNDPHYLRTGQVCIKNIENKHLKEEQDKRNAFKKACHKHKFHRVSRKSKEGQLKEKKGKKHKEKSIESKSEPTGPKPFVVRDRKKENREAKQRKQRLKNEMQIKQRKRMIETKRQERRYVREERKEKRMEKLEKEKQMRKDKAAAEATRERLRLLRKLDKERQKNMHQQENEEDRRWKEETKKEDKKLKKQEKLEDAMSKKLTLEGKHKAKKEIKKQYILDEERMRIKMDQEYKGKEKEIQKSPGKEKNPGGRKNHGVKKNPSAKKSPGSKGGYQNKKNKTTDNKKKDDPKKPKASSSKKRGESTKKAKAKPKSKSDTDDEDNSSISEMRERKERQPSYSKNKKKGTEKAKASPLNKKKDITLKAKTKTKSESGTDVEDDGSISEMRERKERLPSYSKKNQEGTKKAKTKPKSESDTDDEDDRSISEMRERKEGLPPLKLKDYCYKGICSNALKNKTVKFICKCKKRNFFKPQCTNETCVGVIPPPPAPEDKKNKMSKLSCVCKKVSKKLLGKESPDPYIPICKGGQCQRAKEKYEDFLCKCIPQVKCFSSTCTKQNNLKDLVVRDTTKNENEGKCDCGFKWMKVGMQDQIDQTGEPVFEVQVRRGGQEIANLEEVQQKVKVLGRSRTPCTCPTFNKNLEYSIKKVCPTGSCRRAFNSKSIAINCKCETRKSKFCTDKTCNLEDIESSVQKCGIEQNIYKNIQRYTTIDPLFSLNVNTDENTILNSRDIHQRIASHRQNNQFCNIGRCRDSFNTGVIDFICKCSKNTKSCTDQTCDVEKEKKWKPIKKEKRKTETEKTNKGNKEKRKIEKEKPDLEGVSEVTVSPKEEDLEDYCECEVANCDCSPHSPLACLKKLCGKKKGGSGKKEVYKKENKNHPKIQNQKDHETDDYEISKPKHEKEHRHKERYLHHTDKKHKHKENHQKIYNAKIKARRAEITREREEIQRFKKQELMLINEEMGDGEVNLCTACISGIVTFIMQLLEKLYDITYMIVRHPNIAMAYTKAKLKDPKKSFLQAKHAFKFFCRRKLLRIKNNLAKSETVCMLYDEFITSKFAKIFLSKSKRTYNTVIQSTKRKIHRKEAAMYSCRHITLLTMKNLPCMWFFYLCPDYYPKLLSCLSVSRKFLDAIMGVGAILLWTPFFISLEVIRLLFCCSMCTQ